MSMNTRARWRSALLGLFTLLALLCAGAVAAPAASAAPCQTCPEGPGGDPGPPGPPPMTHRLTIRVLTPLQNQDAVVDQVYIKINGQKVWGPFEASYLRGPEYPNVARGLLGAVGSTIADVEVWDDDDFGDDRIGLAHVKANGSTAGVNSQLIFAESGATYTMDITVQRIS